MVALIRATRGRYLSTDLLPITPPPSTSCRSAQPS